MAPKSRKSRTTRAKPTQADVEKVIRSMAEKKCFITAATNQSSSATGTMWAVTQGIIQGDSVSTRDGTQIYVEHVSITFDVFMPTATVAAGVRMIGFHDTMNTGVLPAVTDVLHAATLISPYSTIQQITNRFHVFADVTKNLTTGGVQQFVYNMRRNLRIKTSYNGTTDAAASNGKNAIFFLIITDVGTNVPTYDFSIAVRYLDM